MLSSAHAKLSMCSSAICLYIKSFEDLRFLAPCILPNFVCFDPKVNNAFMCGKLVRVCLLELIWIRSYVFLPVLVSKTRSRKSICLVFAFLNTLYPDDACVCLYELVNVSCFLCV
jgi:hypothetical protein